MKKINNCYLFTAYGGGHSLRSLNGNVSLEPDEYGIPWSIRKIDMGLISDLSNGKDVHDGKVYSLFKPDNSNKGTGWWAFVWWDRSFDHRMGSNSGLYISGFTANDCETAYKATTTMWRDHLRMQTIGLRLIS